MDIKHVMVSERNQSQKMKYCDSIYMEFQHREMYIKTESGWRWGGQSGDSSSVGSFFLR